MMLQLGDDGVVTSVNEEELVYVDKNELEQLLEGYQQLKKEKEQLKQRINSRLHFYHELYESTNDNVVKRVIEDLEDILK